MSAYFSTECMPPARRKEAWLDAWQQVCGKFTVDFERSGFFGEIDHRRIGELDAVRVTQTSRSARRSAAQCASEDLGYFLIFQTAGRFRFTTGNQQVMVAPGEAIMVDSLRAFECTYSGKNIALSFHIPRNELTSRVGRDMQFACMPVGGALLPFLRSFANSAFEAGPAAYPRSNRSIRSALLDLAGDSLTELRPGAASIAHPARQRSLADRIREFIRSNLADPRLSPATIATEFGISQRQLHRTFRDSGASVGRLIRTARLHQCAQELLWSGEGARSVSAIAFAWGFCDLPHFSRSFREEFGQSPREYRRQTGLPSAAVLS